MAVDYTKRVLFLTEDGSSSLQLTETEEQYHSKFGALNESRHIYIERGIRCFPESQPLNILEVGFGTGLNALLTLAENRSAAIEYTTIEPFPLSISEAEMLNYPQLINPSLRELFLQMHRCAPSQTHHISNRFAFTKLLTTLEAASLPANYFHLVYFDLFGPDVEPKLWELPNFLKIAQALTFQGVLITYCAKGVVKRTLKTAGFTIESLPGPVGKREITRAIKN